MHIASTFWDIAWFFLWAFAFIAYLMVLFSIISDLFRDHHLNGWFKAIWILFLIFVPFLTALVYLIARGRGMAERSAKQARANEAELQSYVQNLGGGGPSDEIAKAKKLLDDGAITSDEFTKLKARLLATK